jgi:hypothetical protein
LLLVHVLAFRHCRRTHSLAGGGVRINSIEIGQSEHSNIGHISLRQHGLWDVRQWHLPWRRWQYLARWFTQVKATHGVILLPVYVSPLLSLGAALADSNDAPAKVMRAIATIMPILTTYPLLLMRAFPERQSTAAVSLQDAGWLLAPPSISGSRL